jgi:hypothetical protein
VFFWNFISNFFFTALLATVSQSASGGPKMGHQSHFSSEHSLYRNILPQRMKPL